MGRLRGVPVWDLFRVLKATVDLADLLDRIGTERALLDPGSPTAAWTCREAAEPKDRRAYGLDLRWPCSTDQP